MSSRSVIGCHSDDSWLRFRLAGKALKRSELMSLCHAAYNILRLPSSLDLVGASSYCVLAMTPDSQALQLLQACVDEDDDSYLRFLVDGKSIKYITIAPGIFATDDMCFGPSITRLLPPLPTGDWNHGYIARNPRTSLPYFAQAVTRNMRGVTNVWHPTIVNHLQLVTEKSCGREFMRPPVRNF